MMITVRTTWMTVLALLAVAAAKPAADAGKLRGSAAMPKPKPKAATAIDRFQALIGNKAPWGLYDAAHWSAADGKLREAGGNGRDAVSEGSVTRGSGVGHGARGNVSFISGSTSSRIYWPEGSIPPSFTLCTITRYTGGVKRRLLQAAHGNWFHGHWIGAAGTVYYESWQSNPDLRDDGNIDWVVVCGSNGLEPPNNVLFDGVAVGQGSGGRGGDILAVNPATANHPDESDWALSFVAIWDKVLAAEEMQTVSDALMEYLDTGRSVFDVSTAAAAGGPTTTVTTSNTNGTTTVTTSHGTTTTTTTALDGSTTTVTNTARRPPPPPPTTAR